MRKILIVVCAFALGVACVPRQDSSATPHAAPTVVLPQPEVELLGFQLLEEQGSPAVEVLLRFRNHGDFHDNLFAQAPDLPPCGKNAEASRTWLTISSEEGRHLFGSCLLGRAAELQHTSFTVADGSSLPRAAYVELWDRKLNIRYRSELIPLRPQGIDGHSSGIGAADVGIPLSYYQFMGEVETELGQRFGPPTARYENTWEYLVEDRDEITVVACFGVESGRVAAAYLKEASSERLMRCLAEPVIE